MVGILDVRCGGLGFGFKDLMFEVCSVLLA